MEKTQTKSPSNESLSHERTSEQCEQMSERASGWPSTTVWFLDYSGPQCATGIRKVWTQNSGRSSCRINRNWHWQQMFFLLSVDFLWPWVPLTPLLTRCLTKRIRFGDTGAKWLPTANFRPPPIFQEDDEYYICLSVSVSCEPSSFIEFAPVRFTREWNWWYRWKSDWKQAKESKIWCPKCRKKLP